MAKKKRTSFQFIIEPYAKLHAAYAKLRLSLKIHFEYYSSSNDYICNPTVWIDLSRLGMDEMSNLLIVGSWELQSYFKRDDDGRLEYPMGEHPSGLIMYSQDGHMSVQIMVANRPRFQSDQLHEKTEYEIGQAARGYFAYSGLYEIEVLDEAEAGDGKVVRGLITHHMVNSLFPNWEGRSLIRQMRLQDDLLELSTCQAGMYKGRMMTTHLVWRRNQHKHALHQLAGQSFELINA
ncbi:lipocalin-like domain-containing protein [Chromobacterium phragmitis]|uniref:lipocalin-like domain-containing protein n=1 Tax=Chromobacterium amazonense TaxID=1382803 RepID=UPI0021B802C9|nr:lipocalin-like domain-containing protein [Chromobacterium amazonense]MBM2883303.1 lipocalin-like domain-containing protein [Chromobacterium amazonense]